MRPDATGKRIYPDAPSSPLVPQNLRIETDKPSISEPSI